MARYTARVARSARAWGLLWLATGCQASAPAPPAPVAVIVPSATSAPPPAAPSAAPAQPCTPYTWPAVDQPSDVVRFGAGEPDAVALAAASAPLRAACKRIEADNKTHASPRLDAKVRRELQAATTLGCYAGAKGAWAFPVGPWHRERNGVGDEATWQLVYLDPDGKRLTSPDTQGTQWSADGEGNLSTGLEGVHDFDGDGVDEVALHTGGYASIDGWHDSGPMIYRVKDGAIVRWDPVPGRRVLGSMDADHDGRIDLLLDAEVVPRTVTGASRYELAHALPDGTFALDDEVTHAFLHGQCKLSWPSSQMAPTIPIYGGPASLLTPDLERVLARYTQRCASLLAMDCADAGAR
jgi:hypothetical protein